MQPLLKVQELNFGYTPKVPILRDFKAEFLPGEVVALTGPSGTGKSTLLYLLGLMRRADAGIIEVQGRDAAKLPDHQQAALRASVFGFVFQDAALDPTRTVLDNITETALYRNEPLGPARERARELMERFGVDLRADHRPGQISGGQAQRVAVCRALLGNPQILLADEPTGNLDRGSAEVVVGALHSVAKDGGTVIVATHDPHLMEACSRRIELCPVA